MLKQAETSIDSGNSMDSSSLMDSRNIEQDSKEESIDTSGSEKESMHEESVEAGNKNNGGQENELAIHNFYDIGSKPTEIVKGDENRGETKTNQEEGRTNKQHIKSIAHSQEDSKTLFQKIIKGKLRENTTTQQEEYEYNYTKEEKKKRIKHEEEKSGEIKETCLYIINGSANLKSQYNKLTKCIFISIRKQYSMQTR